MTRVDPRVCMTAEPALFPFFILADTLPNIKVDQRFERIKKTCLCEAILKESGPC